MKTCIALVVRGALVVVVCGLQLWASLAAAEEPAVPLKEVKLDALTLKVPTTWIQQATTSNLRLGTIQIPAVEGDKEPAELGVFNFGSGGGIKDNVERWISQFEAAERKATTTTGKSSYGNYVLVEIAGTYKKPIGPPIQNKTQKSPDYRLVGVILAVENKGNFFLKLTGPEKTVAAATDALRASFGGDKKQEKPYEQDK